MAPDFEHHFSDRNIPFGIASSSLHEQLQAVTRLGNTVLFLDDLNAAGIFKNVKGLPELAFSQTTLNEFATLPKPIHTAIREIVQHTFHRDGLEGFPVSSREHIAAVTMHLPVEVRDFLDFSCSLSHVQNAGRIINKSDRLPPGFSKFPIGYQGRASSIVVSGTDIERPCGQFWTAPMTTPPGEAAVAFGPSQRVDYEVELAAVIGKPLPMRQRLQAADAEDHIFGFVILNDWSARDIQGFEMSPLGPFNGKSFGTSISPWIVTLDALNSFKVPRPSQEISVASYLENPSPLTYGITLEVEIIADAVATKTGVCQVQSLFWTPQQMVAHSVSSGSALRTGDLLATGTISGSAKGAQGCLLETTEGGAHPVTLNDGSHRTFLRDGDVVRMTGFAGEPSSGVGFGDCSGLLVASRPFEDYTDSSVVI